MITTMTEAMEYLFTHFSQHLVALGCIHRRITSDGKPDSPWHNFLGSGFIVCNGDNWYFATAGHCIKDLLTLCQREDVEFHLPYFSDRFAASDIPRMPLHFRIEDREVAFIDSESKGIDLGLLRLNHLEVLAFQKSGRIPLENEHWTAKPSAKIDKYFMTGLSVEGSFVEESDGQPSANIRSNFFPVRQVDARPTVNPETAWTAFRIPESGPGNIDGMSGCPIFAVQQEGTQVKYWVIALQSRWNAEQRIAFTCRLPEFSRIFEDIERKL